MPKTANSSSNDYIGRLQHAIRRVTGCESNYVEMVAVSESFNGFKVHKEWKGEVAVFELRNHPAAKRAYAWADRPHDAETRYVVVLQVDPVTSAQTAVNAAIAAEIVDAKQHTVPKEN